MDNQKTAAMQQSGGILSSLGAEPTPPLLDLADIARELNRIADRLENNQIAYSQLANRIYGPVPPKAAGENAIQRDQTALGSIHEAISTLLTQMDKAEETLQRFSTLA